MTNENDGGFRAPSVNDRSTLTLHTPVHVHDLPQVYQKPSATCLLHALDLLALEASTFSIDDGQTSKDSVIPSSGVPRYLTTIVSSSLAWIEDDDLREQIWNTASTRLSERSGRSAMSSITRQIDITHELAISLHEPALTGDNLGFKTWTSSVLLAKRLRDLQSHLSPICNQILELGAGTGLVGIAAACLWNIHVLLTDLPEIVPNLQLNVTRNSEIIRKNQGSVQAQALDWADDSDVPKREEDKYFVILAADPIYSPDHPKLLVNTVSRWLQPLPEARFILELPLRKSYAKERAALKHLLEAIPLAIVQEGTEIGYDDWRDNRGNLTEVECWWSVWKPVSYAPHEH